MKHSDPNTSRPAGASPHRAPVAAAIIAMAGLALLLAACGGGRSPTGSNASANARASTNSQKALAYSRCMRSHGATDFPDPNAAGGFSFSGSTSSPAFKSAQTACANLVPTKAVANTGNPTPQTRAAYHLQLVNWAKCMRRHGYPELPDPTPGSPQPGQVRGTAWGGGPGWWISIPPSINAYSPQFSQTATTCSTETHQSYR